MGQTDRDRIARNVAVYSERQQPLIRERERAKRAASKKKPGAVQPLSDPAVLA
jgi:IS4 transposase